ncbi:hypothetical protein [Anaerocolumna jejuensis]|uniref:hypothetical protein n=1 Tax=Anaerocolumna jejuensis TaxID=259063 RepID=UPI003F7B98BE
MLKEIIQNQKIKAVIATVIVIFLFIVVYCAIQPKKENNSLISKTAESEEVIAVSGDWKQPNKTVESKTNNVTDYKVNIKEYIAYNEKNKPFKVKYAQISGSGNESLQSHINQTLKALVTEWVNKDCKWVEKFQIAVRCKSTKYLSLCYTIEWENSHGKDLVGTFTRFGVTVDIHTGKRVFLDDLFKGTADLKQELIKYDYGNEISPPIDPAEADEIIHESSISEKKYFEENYDADSDVYNFLQGKSSFYLKDNKLVITRDENEFDDVYIDFNGKSSPTDNPIQQANSNVKTSEKTGEENYSSNEKIYRIESVSYNEKKVNISFPSVVGLSDTAKQNKINEILKHEAHVVLNNFYGGVINNLSLKINYTITWTSKNLLSVQYEGHAFDKGAAYPLNLLYTVNIDIEKGSKLMLKDYINIDKDFVYKYRSYKVPDPDKNQMEAGAFKYILDTYSADDLLQYFNSADTSFKESAFTFSYFKEDSLGISIEVPHVAGDHLEVELKYKDIKDNIKTESGIWKDLIK